MANFAEIDENNMVLRVLVVADDLEARGAEFLANDLGLGGTWIQCSFNGSIRKQYPGIGYTYDEKADVFVVPKPFPSWEIDEKNDWKAPKDLPKDGKQYQWDDSPVGWVEISTSKKG